MTDIGVHLTQLIAKSFKASIHAQSCAMMVSSVTPPAEEEGAEVDGAVEAGGAAICIWGYLERSCAKLRFTIAVSMEHIYKK